MKSNNQVVMVCKNVLDIDIDSFSLKGFEKDNHKKIVAVGTHYLK